VVRQGRIVVLVAVMVAVIGLADSGYLTVKHLRGDYVRCEDDCSAVLGSKYAEIAGVPLAGVGAVAYFVVFVAAMLAAIGQMRAWRVVVLFAIPMALTSLWLVYLQAFIIHAFCRYCLLSAAACIALAGLVLTEWLLRHRAR
jgi:uncharacterized membrane protein